MPTDEHPIRVIVIDDSLSSKAFLTHTLSLCPNVVIVAFAVNAIDAKGKMSASAADVLILSVELGALSHLRFLSQYLHESTLPVVFVSSLDLRASGALPSPADFFVKKPQREQQAPQFAAALYQVLHQAYAAKPAMPQQPRLPHSDAALPASAGLDQVIIAIGASTGGTETTFQVLQELPRDIPAIVIVQHMPKGFTKMYADRLNSLCAMEVREAQHADELRRGLALVAPAGVQTRVVHSAGRYTLSCCTQEKVSGHCPSVDVLFQSIAEQATCPTVGIILTGMGRDGAAGLLAMRQKGAFTIGQDEASSIVYGMPKAAYDIGAVMQQASHTRIPSVLLRHLEKYF